MKHLKKDRVTNVNLKNENRERIITFGNVELTGNFVVPHENQMKEPEDIYPWEEKFQSSVIVDHLKTS